MCPGARRMPRIRGATPRCTTCVHACGLHVSGEPRVATLHSQQKHAAQSQAQHENPCWPQHQPRDTLSTAEGARCGGALLIVACRRARPNVLQFFPGDHPITILLIITGFYEIFGILQSIRPATAQLLLPCASALVLFALGLVARRMFAVSRRPWVPWSGAAAVPLADARASLKRRQTKRPLAAGWGADVRSPRGSHGPSCDRWR